MIQRTILGRSTKQIIAVTSIAISVAVAFGLQWTGEQVALINALINSVILLVANEDS